MTDFGDEEHLKIKFFQPEAELDEVPEKEAHPKDKSPHFKDPYQSPGSSRLDYDVHDIIETTKRTYQEEFGKAKYQ